jgi:hypothetical protein
MTHEPRVWDDGSEVALVSQQTTPEVAQNTTNLVAKLGEVATYSEGPRMGKAKPIIIGPGDTMHFPAGYIVTGI